MKVSKILFGIVITMLQTANATDRLFTENGSYVVHVPDTYEHDTYEHEQSETEHRENSKLDVILDFIKITAQYPRELVTASIECAKDTVYAFSVLGNDLSKWQRIQNRAIKQFGDCVYDGYNFVKRQLTDTRVLESFANYNYN